jgi:ferredoxin
MAHRAADASKAVLPVFRLPLANAEPKEPTAQHVVRPAGGTDDRTRQPLFKSLAPEGSALRQIRLRRTAYPAIARVDPEQCTACGVCEAVCPAGAISVDDVARIDAARCAGCGLCVAECPQGALSLDSADVQS